LGQSIVELTLLLPFLVLIFLAAIDLTRLFYHASAIAQAARAGAQYGAQNMGAAADIGGMRTAAREAGFDLRMVDADITPAPVRKWQCPSDANPTTTEVTSCSDGSAPKVFVEVSAQKQFSTIFKYPGMSHSLNVSRTAIMRVQ
jgi:hypothetical protein